jgi:methylenetetrahydrofolate reductase (NADPH)
LPKIFNIDIPEALSDALIKAKTENEAKEIGIQWGIQQSKELIKNGVPCLHFYTMGKSESVRRIVKEVF